MITKLQKILQKAWEEGKHPRADDGRFGSKGGTHDAGGKSPVAGRATATMTTRGREAVQIARDKHFGDEGIKALRQYVNDNYGGNPELIRHIDFAEGVGGERGYKYALKRLNDKLGSPDGLKAVHERLRVAGMRERKKAKAVHAAAPPPAPIHIPTPTPAGPGTTTAVRNAEDNHYDGGIKRLRAVAEKFANPLDLDDIEKEAGRRGGGKAGYDYVREALVYNYPAQKDEINREHDRIRVAFGAKGRIKDKIRAAHGHGGTGKAPAPAPAALPTAEKQKIAGEVFGNAMDNIYKEVKYLMGKNNDLYNLRNKYRASGFKDKAEFMDFVKEAKAICLANKVSRDLVDKHVFPAMDEFDDRVSTPAVGFISKIFDKIKKLVNPAHAKALDDFHTLPIGKIKMTKHDGANEDVNYTVDLTGDGRVCMKGISEKHGDEYGMPASEVCAYEASALMGFDIMQPTTYRDHETNGKTYPHSAQAWVNHGMVGSDIASRPPRTPALEDSVSQMIAFDFAMFNRDRNPGNYMLDMDSGTVRGIDNGLVLLEAGREGTFGIPWVEHRMVPNAEAYCAKMLGTRDIGGCVKPEHIAKAAKFVKSKEYDELLEAHYGAGTPGGRQLKKRGISFEEFKKNAHDASNRGIELLNNIYH